MPRVRPSDRYIASFERIFLPGNGIFILFADVNFVASKNESILYRPSSFLRGKKKKKKERVNYDISANFNEAVERFRYKTVETSEKSHLERTRYPLHPETTFVPLCVTQFNLRTRRLISPLIKETLAKSYRMVYRVIAKLPITSHCLIDVSKESRVSMDSDNRCQSSYKRREKKKKIRANDKLILSH